jgi:hypothetical protein
MMARVKTPDVKKKTLWDWFSKYIRLKAVYNNEGMVKCVTCGKSFHWKNVQAGHFVHGTSSMSWLDERNVHPQCVHCNKHKHGNTVKYASFIIKTYGHKTVDELLKLNGIVRKWKVGQRKELSDYYRGEIKKHEDKHDYLPPECRPFSKETV